MSSMIMLSQIIVAGGFTIEIPILVSENKSNHSSRKVCIMTVENDGAFLKSKGMTLNVFLSYGVKK